MMDSLLNSDYIFMVAGGSLLLAILFFTYVRYSTSRFRTNAAFKHNEAGLDMMRRSKFTEAIREFEIALGLDPNVEIFKNNIEIAKVRMVEAKHKEKGKMDALGLKYDE